MRVAMHQSQYLPWPPYFKKIAKADLFVLMDDVQYQKNGLQNRNRVRNRHDAFWLTIPVSGRLQDTIADKRIADPRWAGRHWKSLQAAYGRAPGWDRHRDALESLYAGEYATLSEANEAFLRWMLNTLGIDTPIKKLSDLAVAGTKSGLVLNACLSLGADRYLSGMGAAGYLDLAAFREAGVAIEFMEAQPPVYRQYHGDFMAGLSMVDMLMNQDAERIRDYLEK